MGMNVGASGVYKDVVAAYVGAGGVWKPILNLYTGAGAAWKLGYAALSVSLDTGLVTGECQRSTAGSCSAVTTSITATITGGSGSYTIVWEFVSGTSASVRFQGFNSTNFIRDGAVADGGNVIEGLYRCRVTDNVTGAQAVTGNFTVRTRHVLTQ